MQIGMIGLGKMGANMTARLIRGGHSVVVYDHNPDSVAQSALGGATAAASVADLVDKLTAPRTVWVMVPSGDPTNSTVRTLAGLLNAGDTIIDGGNSFYGHSVALGRELAAKDIHFIDVGTSGGVWGLENGYSLMIGGDEAAVERLSPIFKTLAPAEDKGWGRVGPTGAGHYAKMVHNGIEYGMMQAFAEGLSIMRAKSDFAFDLSEVTRIWQHGSVVRSWLLDLIQQSLERDEKLEDIAAYVPDSGEGRWTVFESINLNVSAPVITASLERRIRSREDGYTDKLLSVMRNAFGGHAVKKAGEE
jgi:6-phosphogluconate dehydrogenase